MLVIRDDKTKQVFKVAPTKDRDWVTTRDGVRVKLYPIIIKLTVQRGKQFSGDSPFGPRLMTLISL